MGDTAIPAGPQPACDPRDVIHPAATPPREDDLEATSVWGFRDSAFSVNARGHVEFSGDRYAIAGQELTELLPWMAKTLKVDLDPADRFPRASSQPVPDPRASSELLAEFAKALSPERVCVSPERRLRCSHGHTQDEIFALHTGGLKRIVDVVVEPASRAEIAAVLELSREHNACVVPYGGGTNVTLALAPPPGEARTWVALDLRRMNRVRWIDPRNRLACIEAGAVGRTLQATLAEHGFTLGHEPDSIEFSTLGGWIATAASGMKKNRYGNIEDLVVDVEAVTPSGTLGRARSAPRESVGNDPANWLIGSEGSLGVITCAVVKLFPLPEVKRYASVVFRDFGSGLGFIEALNAEGDLPASVRLVDNLQFQFSQALRPQSHGWRARKRQLERWFVTRVKGFEPDRMTACTLVYEGSASHVRHQEKRVARLTRQFGGLAGGAENGERGYQLTFSIAYIRDFALQHFILGESFETSVAWSDLEKLCENVKQRLYAEHDKRGLPGRPFVTCRVTQLYDTGVCVYFYFAFHFQGVTQPSELFAEIERAARDEILASGGSLSHHHGIGKLRAGFLDRVFSGAALRFRRELKHQIDPENLLGAGNQGLS